MTPQLNSFHKLLVKTSSKTRIQVNSSSKQTFASVQLRDLSDSEEEVPERPGTAKVLEDSSPATELKSSKREKKARKESDELTDEKLKHGGAKKSKGDSDEMRCSSGKKKSPRSEKKSKEDLEEAESDADDEPSPTDVPRAGSDGDKKIGEEELRESRETREAREKWRERSATRKKSLLPFSVRLLLGVPKLLERAN